jgi:hypothetical protein
MNEQTAVLSSRHVDPRAIIVDVLFVGIIGLGFSGIIPAYLVAIRELLPAAEAAWRIPTPLRWPVRMPGIGRAKGGPDQPRR